MQPRLLPLLVILLWLGACGTKLNEENFDRINNGMPKQEVIAILGQPTETSGLQLGNLSGTSAVWEDGTTRITIQFINDKVKVKQFTRSDNSPIE